MFGNVTALPSQQVGGPDVSGHFERVASRDHRREGAPRRRLLLRTVDVLHWPICL